MTRLFDCILNDYRLFDCLLNDYRLFDLILYDCWPNDWRLNDSGLNVYRLHDKLPKNVNIRKLPLYVFFSNMLLIYIKLSTQLKL